MMDDFAARIILSILQGKKDSPTETSLREAVNDEPLGYQRLNDAQLAAPDEANPEMAALRATLPDFDSTPALSIKII